MFRVTSLLSLSFPVCVCFSQSLTHEPSGVLAAAALGSALASFFAWAEAGCGETASKRNVPPRAIVAAMAPTRAMRAQYPELRNEFAMLRLTFPCQIGPVPTGARCRYFCGLRVAGNKGPIAAIP